MFSPANENLGEASVNGERGHTLPEFKARDVGTDRIDLSDCLVAGDERNLRRKWVVAAQHD